MTKVRKLTDEEIERRVSDLDGWELVGGKLHRTFRFPGFVEAFGFMSSLALVAEREGFPYRAGGQESALENEGQDRD